MFDSTFLKYIIYFNLTVTSNMWLKTSISLQQLLESCQLKDMFQVDYHLSSLKCT